MKLSNYRGFNSAMLSMLVYEGFEPSLSNLTILRTVEDQAFRETIYLEGGTAFLHYSTKFIWDSLKYDDYMSHSLVSLKAKPSQGDMAYALMAIKGDLPVFVVSLNDNAKRGSFFDRVMRSTFDSHQYVQYDFLLNPEFVFKSEADALSALEKAKALEDDLFWSKATEFKVVALGAETFSHLERAWCDTYRS